MITLKEGFKLLGKGNQEAFKKALDAGNELECYQIVFGNKDWSRDWDVLKELETLAQGVGKYYYDNGRLLSSANYKDGKLHGLHEEWDKGGHLMFRTNYKNGERHGLRERLGSDGKLYYRVNYNNGKFVS